MIMKKTMIVLFALLICINIAVAEDTKSLKAKKVTGEIRADGALTEEAWEKASWFKDFRQSVPTLGKPSTEPTEVAILFDEKYIYVGVRCFDSEPDKIIANQLMHREDLTQDDHVTVIFDTYQDQTRGTMFMVNSLGTKEEGQVGGYRSYNLNWNEVWQAGAQRIPGGWEAELAIPLRILRYKSGNNQTWGINVQRSIKRKVEEVFIVPPTPPFDISSLNFAAKLEGLDLNPSGINLQVLPYFLAGNTRDEVAGTDESTTEVGVDAKYAVTSDLVLDVTANTDFAQVEADTEQVNLTRFSLFYPEKREFFLENSSLFSFGGNNYHPSVVPFFSRKIGLYRGATVLIDLGLRLSGKMMGQDVGLLSVRTGDVSELGLDSAYYNVMRVKHNFDGRSYFGGIYTQSDRGDFSSKTFGGDISWWPTAGLNLKAEAVTVDQEDLKDQHSTFKLVADYTSDDFGYMASHQQVGENFNPDLGFVRRHGYKENRLFLRKSGRPGNWLRRYTLQFSGAEISTMDDLLESKDASLEFELDLESGDNFKTKYEKKFERLFYDFEVSDGLVFTPGDYDFSDIKFEFKSNESRKLVLNAEAMFGEYYGADRRDLNFGVQYVLNRHFTAGVFADNYNITSDLQEDLDWTLIGVKLRVTITPDLYVSSFVQYNSSTGNIIVNLRLRLLYANESGLYLVYNEKRFEDQFDRWHLDSRQAIAKINYRIVF
jgi:hypothetical protein